MTCLRLILLAGAIVCGTFAMAQAQPRALDEQFTDIDLLFNILRATVDGINIDDPAVLEAEFPGAQFADFDRDRNGEFMTFGAGLGLFDLTLAIMQFNHDPVDADLVRDRPRRRLVVVSAARRRRRASSSRR